MDVEPCERLIQVILFVDKHFRNNSVDTQRERRNICSWGVRGINFNPSHISGSRVQKINYWPGMNLQDKVYYNNLIQTKKLISFRPAKISLK